MKPTLDVGKIGSMGLLDRSFPGAFGLQERSARSAKQSALKGEALEPEAVYIKYCQSQNAVCTCLCQTAHCPSKKINPF